MFQPHDQSLCTALRPWAWSTNALLIHPLCYVDFLQLIIIGYILSVIEMLKCKDSSNNFIMHVTENALAIIMLLHDFVCDFSRIWSVCHIGAL